MIKTFNFLINEMSPSGKTFNNFQEIMTKILIHVSDKSKAGYCC
jgi:hypothetical protein